jgi:hypothetical protein
MWTSPFFDGVELLNGMTRLRFYINTSCIVNINHYEATKKTAYFSCQAKFKPVQGSVKRLAIKLFLGLSSHE